MNDTDPLFPDRDRPEAGFRALADRPTPELDADRLWLRLEDRRGRTPGSRRSRRSGLSPVWLAWAAAAAALVVLVWAGGWVGPAEGGSRLVLLEPAGDLSGEAAPLGEPASPGQAAGAAVEGAGNTVLELDVRLVRGYEGAPPAGVRDAATAGAGGADALLDARADIESLLPFESFGLVGAGRAELPGSGSLEIALSGDYRLLAGSVEFADSAEGTVRLEGFELVGAGQDSTSADLSLEPGRLYVLGVVAPGSDEPDLVLLLRARALPDRE